MEKMGLEHDLLTKDEMTAPFPYYDKNIYDKI